MSSPVIIIDNGSSNLKGGLSTEYLPLFTIPTLIGRPLIHTDNTFIRKKYSIELKPIMIGEEIIPIIRPFLEISEPIREGIINNFYDMRFLWEYTLTKKLRIDKNDLKDRKIIMSEDSFNSPENKAKMAEIIFEKIGLGFLNVEPKEKMVLAAEGDETGVVVTSGDGLTKITPIINGYLIHNKIKKLDIGGKRITNYLTKLLTVKGYALHHILNFEEMKNIKEKLCFVSCDIESDRKLERETSFNNIFTKLPDGTTIRISEERFEAPEILFQPYLIQDESPGIHETLFKVLNVFKYLYNFLFILVN